MNINIVIFLFSSCGFLLQNKDQYKLIAKIYQKVFNAFNK